MTKNATAPKSAAALAKLPKSSLFNFKPLSVKDASVSTYRKKRNFSLLSGKWCLLTATEIEKARKKHLRATCNASKTVVPDGSCSNTSCTVPQTFARTVGQVTLRAVNEELDSDLDAISCRQLPQECNIQEELPMVNYGYQDVSLTSDSDNSQSASAWQHLGGRRLYQRRGSVTEFSLKAAAIAKIQLDREDGYGDASRDVVSGNK